MQASVQVCKCASKPRQDKGKCWQLISFQETRQQHVSFLIVDQEEEELHQIIPHYITAHTSNPPAVMLSREVFYREALLQSPHSAGNHLAASQNLAGQHLGQLRHDPDLLFLFSCRHNFPQRFINLIVCSTPPELLQGKFLLGAHPTTCLEGRVGKPKQRFSTAKGFCPPQRTFC